MCTEKQLASIKHELTSGIKAALGDKLYRVLLYGSYACGDYDEESDMDFMVIADVPEAELGRYRKAVNRVASRTGLKNDMLLSVSMMDRTTIYAKRNVLPFFDAVLTEGEVIYAS